MPQQLKIFKLDSIPSTLEPSALYFVKTGVNNLVNIYVTDMYGAVIYRNHDSSDISQICTVILTALRGQPGGLAELDYDGLVDGNLNGNAATATKLATPRAINGINFDGSADITIATGGISEPIIIASTDNVKPIVEGLKLFRKKLASRNMFSFIADKGYDQIFQPLLGRNKIGVYSPAGNSTTVPGQYGMPALTVTGTLTARNITVTNNVTFARRLGFVSGNTNGSLCGYRVAVAQHAIGANDNMGGFFMVHRFAISDASLVNVARMFIGMRSSTASPSNASPATLTNSIGIGHDANDTNLSIYYGGIAAQTPIDLGANFPVSNNEDMYELILYSCIEGNKTIYWQVTRINTGHTIDGAIVDSTGIVMPSGNTLLTSINAYRTNNTNNSRVGLDLMSHYIETEF